MRTRGFTLIELLVALVLVSLLFLLLIGGLQFGTDAWRKSEETQSSASELVVVQDFLRTTLGGARPMAIASGSVHGRDVFFEGAVNSLRFVAPLNRHFGLGGFSELAISVTKDDQSGLGMEIAVRPFRRATALSDNGLAWKRVSLINGLAQIEFAYFGYRKTGETAQWYSAWSNLQYTPELIRLRMKFRDGRLWPDIVVPLMVRSVTLITQEPQTEVFDQSIAARQSPEGASVPVLAQSPQSSGFPF